MRTRTLLLSCGMLLAATLRPASSGCFNDNESDDQPPATNADRVNMYTGEQTFSLSLLKAIYEATPTDNIFFSPYSTFSVLLLAYFSARNEAEASLYKTLHLNWSKSKMHVLQTFRYEKQSYAGELKNSSVEFDTADKLFVSKEMVIRQCMKNLFSEELEVKDFAANGEKCRTEINQWIEDKTRGMIKDVLQPSDVDGSTDLVLANAAFFKGNWSHQFDVDDTKDEAFYSAPNKSSLVPMMNKEAEFKHAFNENLGAQIIHLPYLTKNESVSMVIFLPPLADNGMKNMISKLTPESFRQALNDGHLTKIALKLPKFSFEQQMELQGVLAKVGLEAVFKPDVDFTSLTESTSISLDKGAHKARIEVYEEGSKAAAASTIPTTRSGSPGPTQFFCDHPFLFVIYDSTSQAVLFTGIYRSSPVAAKGE